MQQLVDRLNSTTEEMEALQESFGRTLGLKEIELRSAKDQVCSFKVGMGQFECLCAPLTFVEKTATTKNIARHGSIQVREQKEKFREAQQDLEGKLASLSQMIHSGEARALQIA